MNRRALAQLVYEGYADVAGAFRVRKEIALAVLERSLDLDQCFIAWKGESPVGFQGLVERSGRPLNFRYKLIREHFGVLRSLLYFLLLDARTRRKPVPGEIMFENLVVSAGERKQGIGTRLVERAEAYARENGYESVGMEVVDTNHIALRMFARMSYKTVKTRRFGILTKRAGFTGNHYLRKRISAP